MLDLRLSPLRRAQSERLSASRGAMRACAGMSATLPPCRMRLKATRRSAAPTRRRRTHRLIERSDVVADNAVGSVIRRVLHLVLLAGPLRSLKPSLRGGSVPPSACDRKLEEICFIG